MALEAVCFQQELFGCTMKELYNMVGGAWGYDIADAAEKEQQQQQQIKGEAVAWDSSCEIGAGCGGGRGRGDGLMHAGNWDASCSSMVQGFDEWDMNSSSPETGIKEVGAGVGEQEGTGGRRKRRRTKSSKNKEEVENQRMTHIAVERNRRKQMNEYLAVLRSLMPASYVQRGDQASIIGGAINFVKELEQLVQSLEAQKRIKQHSDTAPFAGFFTFPQYSTSISPPTTQTSSDQGGNLANDAVSARQSAVADIEVTMVESHANLKIFSRKQPKQLIKLVVGLQNLWLTTLHLNVTTINEMVLYSFSLKVEDNCQLTTVDEIATAVHQMVVMIQEQAASLE